MRCAEPERVERRHDLFLHDRSNGLPLPLRVEHAERVRGIDRLRGCVAAFPIATLHDSGEEHPWMTFLA